MGRGIRLGTGDLAEAGRIWSELWRLEAPGQAELNEAMALREGLAARS